MGHESINAILETGNEAKLDDLMLNLDEDQVVYLYSYILTDITDAIERGILPKVESLVQIDRDTALKISHALSDDGLLNPEFTEYPLVQQWLLRYEVSV